MRRIYYEPMADYLARYREEIPDWLKNYQPGDKIDFYDIIKGRTAYYPGCLIDGNLLRVCNPAHCLHSYFFLDYGYPVESFLEDILNINGYHSIAHIVWEQADVFPKGISTYKNIYKAHLTGRHYSRKPFTPSFFTEIMERDFDRGDDWGAERFAITYMFADGIDTYYQLFVNTWKTTPFVFLLQEHGLGGENYDKYGKGGLLDSIMTEFDSHPKLVLNGSGSRIWDNYYRIMEAKPTNGGMHHQTRCLYEYKPNKTRL